MRQFKFALTLLASAVLASCGGGGAGDQTLKVKFSSQVSFGDSLSDIGTYAVGTVAALGGGKYNINGDNTSINPFLTGKNWTELMAAQFGLSAPCPAQTGLEGLASQGFNVPVKYNAGCTGYAQGGARVTDPRGPGSVLTGSPLGQLARPVTAQIQRHLEVSGGKFAGTEVVFVLAGGNDAIQGLTDLTAGASAAGAAKFGSTLVGLLAAGAPNPASAAQAIGLAMATEGAKSTSTSTTIVGAAVTAAVTAGNTAVASPSVYGPMVATATAAGTKAGGDYAAANGPALVAAMGKAGAELSNLIKTQIIAKGANYVVVPNLPDLAGSPFAAGADASIQGLIKLMVQTFNDQLVAGIGSESKATIVDLYSVSHDQVINPGIYGLTNTKDAACDTSPAKNPLGSSLVCTKANLAAGDVSHYMFADGVHPTPYAYWLIARYVAERMAVKGWL